MSLLQNTNLIEIRQVYCNSNAFDSFRFVTDHNSTQISFTVTSNFNFD